LSGCRARPMLRSLYSRHLYVRIWLAVVAGVVILTLMANWIVRGLAAERRARAPGAGAARSGGARRARQEDRHGHRAARARPGPGVRRDAERRQGHDAARGAAQAAHRQRPFAPWRTPFGLGWMIALVGVAVALGVYPIVRRITQRLEALQRGVQRWGEGDLSVRVTEEGQDEVAFLAPNDSTRRPSASNPGALAQVAAGQCLARTALAAHAHPHGPGADGRPPERLGARRKSRATSASSTS
jgi:two-component system OmpR family sensor kinase